MTSIAPIPKPVVRLWQLNWMTINGIQNSELFTEREKAIEHLAKLLSGGGRITVTLDRKEVI